MRNRLEKYQQEAQENLQEAQRNQKRWAWHERADHKRVLFVQYVEEEPRARRAVAGMECAAYLDDVVIFSNTWQQHLEHLHRVLETIQQAGLTLNVQKCEWARAETRPLTSKSAFLSRWMLPDVAWEPSSHKENEVKNSLSYSSVENYCHEKQDHRALTWINTMKNKNARVTRWYLELQPFQFCVRHKRGQQNVVADYLSRLPSIATLGEEGGNVTRSSFGTRHQCTTPHTNT
ncbi:uncharacterized protein LOC125311958 [Alosa alosa]|uniref:uncharacterized protein LOC125311958 n=1 Tax=Alosa alosa TaxID=278164 RepID=UPI0020151522|nr:uncharacterized protein LOC125311958 [Alosa alosa]